MIKSNISLYDEISLSQLSKKIRTPIQTLRLILSRPEFNKFRSGKNFILSPALCFHLHKFFELRKQNTTNLKSIEKTQALLLRLRKDL